MVHAKNKSFDLHFLYTLAILCPVQIDQSSIFEMKNLAFMAVCQYFGGQAKTAEILHCTRGFICHVVNGRRPMPTDWAPVIERESKGKFKCEELAPNFPWEVVRNKSGARGNSAK